MASAAPAGGATSGTEPKTGRRAQLVMGEPLGTTPPVLDAQGLPLQADPGTAELANEEILIDLPDSVEDLELTHLRLKTLRGLSLQRFTKVQVRNHLLVWCASMLQGS